MRSGTLSSAIFQRDWQHFITQYGGMAHGGHGARAIAPAGLTCGSNCPSAVTLWMPQQPQANWYYCGPAAAAEALSARGISVSQGTLAGNSYLQTNEYGATNWGSLVMPTTLNDFTHSGFYTAVNADWSSAATFVQDLATDIGEGWPVVIGVQEEDGTGPHLTGHPTNQQINHWVAAHGYTNYGNGTTYDDSVSGDGWIWPWAYNVPPSSTIPSANMYTMMAQGGFGWVW